MLQRICERISFNRRDNNQVRSKEISAIELKYRALKVRWACRPLPLGRTYLHHRSCSQADPTFYQSKSLSDSNNLYDFGQNRKMGWIFLPTSLCNFHPCCSIRVVLRLRWHHTKSFLSHLQPSNHLDKSTSSFPPFSYSPPPSIKSPPTSGPLRLICWSKLTWKNLWVIQKSTE